MTKKPMSVQDQQELLAAKLHVFFESKNALMNSRRTDVGRTSGAK